MSQARGGQDWKRAGIGDLVSIEMRAEDDPVGRVDVEVGNADKLASGNGFRELGKRLTDVKAGC